MGERILQTDGEPVEWPTLESAENLKPLNFKEVAILALYEKRRISNMPPPTVREICRYTELTSTSYVSFLLDKLIEGKYINSWGSKEEATSRGTTIRVNFNTINFLNKTKADISGFPNIPGLTTSVPIK